MLFEKQSLLTGITHQREIPVSPEEVNRWEASGRHIQDYFPNLSADDREFILTGITPEKWNQYIPEPEEDC